MNLTGIRTFFRDRGVSTWRKVFVVFAIFYAVMPLDAIPDVIPVIGWLDDIGVLTLAAGLVWADVRRHHQAKLSAPFDTAVQSR